MLRARAQHVEHNENNTKYFANNEKLTNEQKTIQKLVVDGKDITNRSQILEERIFFKRSINTNVENNTLLRNTHHALIEDEHTII